MADSAASEPPVPAVAPAGAIAQLPTELELRPVEGMARWLGHWLHPLAFRMISMIEQRPATMAGALTPTAAYFRRDRHRHPRIDPATWRLRTSGVAAPRELGLDELRAMPAVERICVMECAGNGNHLMGSAGLIGQARWAGPAFETVLDACGGAGPATHFAFHGLDPIPLVRRGYHYGLSLDELRRAGAIVALSINGEPLPRARGFPARLIVPGIYGMSHVKWLGHIEGKTAPHMGIHNRWVFTNKELHEGKWVRVQARWIGLKSMVTRCRRIEGGTASAADWLLTGWAWGGARPIAGVDVTVDGGRNWSPAELQTPAALFGSDGDAPDAFAHAWSVWSWRWHAPAPGDYTISARARDCDGLLQPLEQDPRVRGHFDQTRVKWRRVRVP
jgi:DMSO/TMAO reductase YedYZ molybdopterin-dependent catalytic subunit